MYTINDIQVFIPTYNRPAFLKKSIESLINQTAGIPDITIFNNGTLKETSKVIAAFSQYGVKEYKSEGGLLECMDKACSMIKTKYVMFFHDDDIVNCKYLEYAINALNKYPNIAFITTRTNDFSKEKQINLLPASDEHYCFETQKDFACYMYANEQIAMQTAIYNTELLKKYPREQEKYGKFFDWPYLVTLSKEGNSIVFCDDRMFYCRRHKGQWTNDDKSSWTVEALTNWHKQFFIAMEADKNFSFGNYIFYSKFKYFFRGGYKGLICKKIKKITPINTAIQYAIKNIGINTNHPLYDHMYLLPALQIISGIPDYYRNFNSSKWVLDVDPKELLMITTLNNLDEELSDLKEKLTLKYFIQQIFSIKNKKQHKIIRFLGFRLKIKRKDYK